MNEFCMILFHAFKRFKYYLIWAIFSLSLLQAQPILLLNGNAEAELFYSGKDSHFFFNGIHKTFANKWQVNVQQLNLLGSVVFSDSWRINTRLQLERKEGLRLNQFRLAQGNIQWNAKEKPLEIKLGRMVNPFGAFNQRQLAPDRLFIDVPLFYGYYVNISDELGLVPDVKFDQTKLVINGAREWGLPNSYYNGYSNGVSLSLELGKKKHVLELAVVNGAPISQVEWSNPIHPGLISRIGLKPVYFWEQGFSFSYGSFLQRNESLNNSLDGLPAYSQVLVGTDWKLGHSFFEWSGEIIYGSYQAPLYIAAQQDFWKINEEVQDMVLDVVNLYTDIKYAPPFLSGSYVAYRFDYLYFSEIDEGYGAVIPWDRNVMRNTIGLGYRITDFLLFKSAYSIQNIKDTDWDLFTWRNSLILHF